MALPMYLVKYYLHKYKQFSLFLASLFIATILLYRYIFFTLMIWSFVLGLSVAYSFLSADFLLPNVFVSLRRSRQHGSEVDDELTLMKVICTVCGQRRCPRHRPELNILAFQPWTNLEIQQSVDQAFDKFLSKIVDEFVYTWYRNLSTDEEFVDELRNSIRFLFSVLLRRAKKVDAPDMITQKLIKAGLQHLHAFLKARETLHAGGDIQEVMLEYLGPNLHYALESRKSELEYLRRLVEKVFPYILRPQALQSRAMCALLREILAASVLMPALDAIADPDMVNNMILIFLDETPPPPAPETPSPMVPFLANFSNHTLVSWNAPQVPPKVSKSTLRFVLGDVMDPEKPDMLYPFMQFLKSEAAINVLQCALSCEEFNKKILNPDLSKEVIGNLHNELKDLYKTYCSANSSDRINFDESIVKELYQIVEGPPEGVIKLRTSTPMFRAYEHLYNLLSYTFLPLFHQSEEYYTMLCGERLASQKSISRDREKPIKKKDLSLANLGTKLKEKFKHPDSRSISSLDKLDIENTDDADTATIASSSSLEEDAPLDDLENNIEQFQTHDLSTWRVTIPRIGNRPGLENPKKTYFVFIVDVKTVDMAGAQWTVARRYNEFYVLEQKLKEFHGEMMNDCSLPPKKLIGTNNQDFIDNKRELFEQFLQKLLTIPYLKGSQLLYNFLKADRAFDFGMDINIGRVLKSVPRKLLKEKGQHLEAFLQIFEKSTEAPKPVPSKQLRRDSRASNMSTSSEKIYQSIYENNACGRARYDQPDQHLLQEQTDIDGIYDTLIYVAQHVFKVPEWCHDVLYTARMFLKATLEAYLDWYIDSKVQQIMQEHRLVSLIYLLTDVLLYNNDPARTDDKKKARYDAAVNGAMKFLPRVAVWAIGEKNHHDGIMTIMHALQQPKLNKQLSYVFLDIVITELFPELNE